MSHTDGTARNRRRGQRRKPAPGARVSCRTGALGLGADLAAGLLDLSESGARLRVRAPLAGGAPVVLGLQAPADPQPLLCRGRVVWCVPAAAGDHLVGVEFLRRLGVAELRRFAGAAADAGAPLRPAAPSLLRVERQEAEPRPEDEWLAPSRPGPALGLLPLEAGAEPVAGYRLTSRLGGGGFAEVWAATAPDGTRAALKFIDTRSRDPGLFRNEVRILRALAEQSHPNLIRLLSVTASGQFLVLCMEQADGDLDSLRQTYLEVSGRHIPPDHLLDLLAQAAAGLDHLAALRLPGPGLAPVGLQHCDVKPSNLLLMGDTVKVADFGLCAPVGVTTHRPGGVRGTPPYAAPELYRGRATDRTDQYALAVTFCSLVRGERMFRKEDGPDGEKESVDLTRARQRELAVLARALHPDPTRRYASCTAFVAALRAAARKRGGSVTQRRLSLPPIGEGVRS